MEVLIDIKRYKTVKDVRRHFVDRAKSNTAHNLRRRGYQLSSGANHVARL